jgi:hypothetical protein
MVKRGFLVRLALGVFVRDLSDNLTRQDIAVAKMTAWGKRLFKYGEKILMELKIVSGDRRVDSTFAMDAHSSTFATIRGRVYLKGIGPRKVKLCQSAVGQIAYALWHLTFRVCSEHAVALASKNFGRTEREQFRMANVYMPAWLAYLCSWRYPPPQLYLPANSNQTTYSF